MVLEGYFIEYCYQYEIDSNIEYTPSIIATNDINAIK